VELQHTFTVPLAIDEAWTAFNDLERIAPCFPGAQITSVDGDDFKGLAKVRLGPISLQYTGTGRWLTRDEAGRRAVIEASGKDKRGNGTASATITAHLEEEGPSSTRVVVDTDLRITGRPAQFGRGVISDVGDKLLGQFATCLSENLAGAPEPAMTAAPPPPGPPAAPAATPEPVAAAAPHVPAAAGTPAQSPPSQAPPTETPGMVEPSAPLPADAQTLPPQPAQPVTSPSIRAVSDEIDLGAVVGPALLQRYGPTLAACLVTALVTWWLARRRVSD
jgi:carbon monoxide dehydrogenase subunit G